MLKKILLGVVALVIILGVIGLFLPRQSHVERVITIDRQPSLVHAVTNSFVRFADWSPWQELDPAMKVSTEGPRSGVGARYNWSGNDKVGTGVQTIVASVPNESVTTDLVFDGMAPSKSTIRLEPVAGGTRVTWALDTDMGMNPIGRYFGLMMDGMVGKDFARGLTRLKTLLESMPNADIAGLDIQIVELQAQPIAYVTTTTATDVPAISAGYARAYGEIGAYLARNKLKQVGPPIGIDGEMTATRFTFDAGIPVDRADAAPAGNVKFRQTYAGRVVSHTHVGPYEQLFATHGKVNAWLAANGYATAGGTLSRYVDDPANTSPEKLRTEMYWPLK